MSPTKTLFILGGPKSGSHLIGGLLTGIHDPFFNLEKPYQVQAIGPEGLMYCATKPKYSCPIYTSGYCYAKGTQFMQSRFLNNSDRFDHEVYCAYSGSYPWMENIKHLEKSNIRTISFIRNPLNQLASFKKHIGLERWANDDAYRQAGQWNNIARRILKISHLDNFMLMKFEDLVIDMSSSMKKIENFTNIPFDLKGKILDSIKCFQGASHGSQYKNSSWTIKDKNDSDIFSRYKTLTNVEKKQIIKVSGELMTTLKYDTNIGDF